MGCTAEDPTGTTDAGGGRRGVRARPSAALLEAIGRAYGSSIAPTADPVDLGGSCNLNLLIGAGDDRYVVRVYRPYVTVDRLHAIQLVRQALIRAGVPCAAPVPTRDGRFWLVLDNRVVEVERFVAHDAVMDTWERLEIGIGVLGRLHAVLRDVQVGPAGRTVQFANHVEARDVVQRTQAGVRRIRAWHPSATEGALADEAEALASAVDRAERFFIPRLPRQLVHGDFWDNNVLFQNGQIVCVTDFDFMGERPRTDDLALTLYFACMKFFEDPASDEQLRRLAGLLSAYDAAAAIPLSATERAALPLAFARQPLWSIGGWVAALDDETAARRHAAGTAASVRWALRLLNELDRWQAALSARP